MSKMSNKMEENYLAKWLNGELSDKDLKVFKQSPEYASFKKIVDTTASFSGPEFDIEKNLKTLRNTHLTNTKKTFQPFTTKTLLRVAAVVTILFASYFVIDPGKTNYSTDYSELIDVKLPDDSEVTLNAESTISFNKRSWKKERKIALNGEAFFKVAKGKSFEVVTDHGNVKVLGTQFNVESREGFFEVTCYEGLVSVSLNNTTTNLSAGKSMLAFNGTIITDSGFGNNPSWVNKESSFKSIPIQFVLNEFKRQYNVEIKTKNIDLTQSFTGSFTNNNINLALKSICTPLNIKFEVLENGEKVLFYAPQIR